MTASGMKIAGLTGLALWLLVPASLPAAEPNRPNILWITCEDICPDLGCYGDREARTPHLDQLAAQGLRFTHAFSVAGVCAPSRSAIITGMYPTTLGTHLSRCQAVPPPQVKCFTEYLRAAGYHCTNNVKTDYNFDCPATAWDECSTRAHWRNRNKGQPFFAVFNIVTTQENRLRGSLAEFAQLTRFLPTEQRHGPERVQLPPYYPDTRVIRQDWARYQDLVSAMDLQVGALLKQLDEDGLADSTIVFFFSDHGRGLPRAMRWIYDAGIRVPLIVRGPGPLAPGRVRDDLVSLIDLAPTVLSLASVEVPAHIQGQVFLGKKATPSRQYVFAARDRIDEAPDVSRCVRSRQFKYIRNFQPAKPYAQYLHAMEQMPTMQELRRLNAQGKLQGPRQLWVLPEKPEAELYDLDADPHEIHNLADTPKHEATLKHLRRVLEQWQKESHDLGLVAEARLQEQWRPGGKWATTERPIVVPSGGMLRGPTQVRITCRTEGASIAWTTADGDNPHWKLYAGELTLTDSTTLRVKACRLGFRDSPEVQAVFRRAPGQPSRP